MSHFRALAIVLTAGALALPATPPRDAGAATSVTIGAQLSEPFAPLIVAAREGIFKTHGLDVKLIAFASAVELTTAVLSGNVDYAFTGAAPVFPVHAKGEKVKIFVSLVNSPAYYLMAAKGITSLQDAVDKGAITGVSGLGSLDYHVIRWMVAKQGYDPDKLKFVAAGPPGTRAKALLAGRLGLTAALPPGTYILEGQGATSLLDMGTMIKTIPFEVGWAMSQKLTAQPDTANTVVAALVDAAAWMLKNPEGAARHVAASLKTPAEQLPYLKRALEYYGKYWIRKGEPIDEAGLRIFLDFFVQSKLVAPEKAATTLKEIYTNDYLK